ncbi:TonB-dependent receptor plug domain-containing protein [Terriglobus roseus]|jgi:outer membrane receptor for ferrienterochelin and colicins|uniref:Iron complex outermembrane recepter protein n=1 Tax=Terriglobus roseus TaxID=392734 RepID=A0A1H4W604_9BACT|nr:TonB-dependent receptor [Terriglobus roseus]SEC88809.1 iron complex outermembrane recepter protein [Terriglobus roseus]
MKAALALLLLCVATTASAQSAGPTIRVEVKTDLGPVNDAVVTTNGKSVSTGPDGTAVLPSSPGRIAIDVSKDGFFPVHTIVTVTANQQAGVEIELQPAKTEEEEVTVYATRTNTRLQDSPLHVEVVGTDEINEELAMRPGDISMLLNEMGGIRVQTTSPGLGASSVRVQGMRGRYTAFLTDGLPLFGQQGAGLGLLQIPPMDLAQVEIIKGNASALYGSSAMAGVVNLISRRPDKKPTREFLFNRSSLGATDGSMFLGSQLTPHWGATLLAGGYGQEHQDLNGDGWADVAGYGRGVFRPRFFWDNKNGGTAVLTAGITYEDRSGGTIAGAVLPVTGQPYTEALKSARYDLGGNAQRILDGRYVLSTRFAASDQDHRHQFGEDVEKDRHGLIFGEVSLRGSARKNTWVAGAAAQRDSYRPHDVPRFSYTYVVPGIFGQDDIEVAPWMSISGSARVDFHNVYGTFFSPRISVLLRKAGWTSRLSVGQGFFAPTPLTEETEAAGLAKLQLLAPLKAERGRNASVDLSRSFGAISLSSTFFASNIDHPVYTDRGAVYELLNLTGPTRNRGVELLATYRKAPFSVTSTYTYVRTSELEPVGGRADVALTPRQNFGVVGTWEREGTTRIGLECYYTGEQRLEYNPYRDVSRPYVLVGAMGERKVTAHVKLFLNLENLTNVRQTRWDPLLLPSRESDGRWTVDAWAPLDGRVANGGAKFSF